MVGRGVVLPPLRAFLLMNTEPIINALFMTFASQQEDVTVNGTTIKCLCATQEVAGTLIPGGYWQDSSTMILCRQSDLPGLDLNAVRKVTFRGSSHQCRAFREGQLPVIWFDLTVAAAPR